MKRIICQSLFLVALCAAPSAIRAEGQTREFVKNSLVLAGGCSFLYGVFNAEHLAEDARTYFEHRSLASQAARQMNELRRVKAIAEDCDDVDEFKMRAHINDGIISGALTGLNWVSWGWGKLTNQDTWDTTQAGIIATIDAQIKACNIARKQALKKAHLTTEIKLTCAGLLAGIVGLVLASR